MRKTVYISPGITLLDVEVEQGYGASQGSPDVNIGIGGWETDEEEFEDLFVYRFKLYSYWFNNA